jgi:hypothetical protein
MEPFDSSQVMDRSFKGLRFMYRYTCLPVRTFISPSHSKAGVIVIKWGGADDVFRKFHIPSMSARKRNGGLHRHYKKNYCKYAPVMSYTVYGSGKCHLRIWENQVLLSKMPV